MLDFDNHHLRILGAPDLAWRVRLCPLSLKNMMTGARLVDMNLPRTHAIREERTGFSELHGNANTEQEPKTQKVLFEKS